MRKKFFGVIFLIFTFLFINLSAQIEQQTKSSSNIEVETMKMETLPVVAKVGKRNITYQDLFNRLWKTNGTQVLNQMVYEILIEEEAKNLNIKVDQKEINERLEDFKKQFRDEQAYNLWLTQNVITEEDLKKQIEFQILQEKLVVKAKKISVLEKEIKDFFESNKEQLAVPEQVKCRHILVKTKEQADDILLSLRAGADFSIIAKAKSEDIATKEKGGDLGYITKGMLLPELEEVVFRLKVGEISEPIKTNLGYHIIKVEDKKGRIEAKFDKQTKERIYKFLLQQKISSQLPSYIEELKNKTEIIVY
ncbi:MAG: peptidylprolyl isomerase [Endomicrobiia bacterium]